MFRGFIVLAACVGVAQSECQNCNFNVTALEEFSVDYELKMLSMSDHMADPACIILPCAVTNPLPDNMPSSHGTIALHARNLQLKLDGHLAFPSPFYVGRVPVSGMQFHEELHVNGAAGQASFHFESPIMHLCFQLDDLPLAQMGHDAIDPMLQQAEQVAPLIMQREGFRTSVDGQLLMAFGSRPLDGELPDGGILFDDSSHPFLIASAEINGEMNDFGPPSDTSHLAVKFDNYSPSVGNQFTVRACEIETQSATQSFLATDPDARTFVASRIAAHQIRLQALLEPQMLNMRFNFIPLEIADLMVPAKPQCATELAQTPPRASGTFQIAAFGVCSFVLGSTFGMLRKKSVTPADESLLGAGRA